MVRIVLTLGAKRAIKRIKKEIENSDLVSFALVKYNRCYGNFTVDVKTKSGKTTLDERRQLYEIGIKVQEKYTGFNSGFDFWIDRGV